MKYIVVSLLAALTLSCNSSQKTTNSNQTDSEKFANTITSAELSEMLYFYASDEMEGRMTGSAGQKKAVEYIKNFSKTSPLKEIGNNNNFALSNCQC